MSLRIQNLSVGYAGKNILSAINDTWAEGQINGIIGSNGAGKSTLLKAVSGLMPATGQLLLNDTVMNKEQQRNQIAYMAQDIGAVSSLTVTEVVILGRLSSLGFTLSKAYIDEAITHLELFGIAHLHARTLDALSGGQRQLVYLAQALFRKPKVLLLDEPTAALDLRHQLLVLEHVRHYANETGAIVAIAMHDLTLASNFSDRIIGINDGRIVADGKPKDVLTDGLLAQLYKVQAEVINSVSGATHIVPTAAIRY